MPCPHRPARLLLLISLFLAACSLSRPSSTAPPASSQPSRAIAHPAMEGSYTTDNAGFKERYPEPMINGRRPTGLGGLMIWEVYDKSEAAEDPIRTSFWLVNGRKEMFRLHGGGIERALRSIRFAPRDGAEARRVALLRYSHDGDYRVMEGPGLPRVNAPAEALSEVSAPRVVRLKGGRYRVSFYVFHSSSAARYLGRDNRSVTRCSALVGPGSLSLSQETVWSSFGGPQ